MQKLNCDCTQEKLCSQTSSVTTSYPPSKNHSIGQRAQTFQFIFKKNLVKESLPQTSLWRHCKTIHHSMDDSKCYIQSQFPQHSLYYALVRSQCFHYQAAKFTPFHIVASSLYFIYLGKKILIQSQSKVLNLRYKWYFRYYLQY